MGAANRRTANLGSALLDHAEPGETLFAPALLAPGVGLLRTCSPSSCGWKAGPRLPGSVSADFHVLRRGSPAGCAPQRQRREYCRLRLSARREFCPKHPTIQSPPTIY